MTTRTPARARTRKTLVVLAQVLCTVLLFALLWQVADGPAALRTLADAQPAWLAAAAALLVTHTLLAAQRWRVTAETLGIPLSPRRATSEYFLAQLVNTTVPGGVVGDAGRAVRTRHDSGLVSAGTAVVVERTIGQLTLLAVAAAAFAITLTVPGGLTWPPDTALALGLAYGALVALTVTAAIGLRSARGEEDGRMRRLVGDLRRGVSTPHALRAQIALSLGTTACILAAFACCAIAVGAPISLAATVAVVPLVLLAMLLPVSIGGWGVREAAAVILLPIAGLSETAAFAASAAFGLMALAAAVPGVAAIWLRRAPGTQTMTGSMQRRTSAPARFSQEAP